MFSFLRRVTLEKQIETLAATGLRLNAGVTIDDLLHSYPRAEFEKEPYKLLLFMLGSEIEREPWGRHISDSAWNFDLECIEGAGSYTRIIRHLLRISGQTGRISGVTDEIEAQDSGTGVLAYKLDGEPRSFEVEIMHDWADADVAIRIMHDIADAAGDGRNFWSADNGQAMVLFFLTEDQAQRINALKRDVLSPV